MDSDVCVCRDKGRRTRQIERGDVSGPLCYIQAVSERGGEAGPSFNKSMLLV